MGTTLKSQAFAFFTLLLLAAPALAADRYLRASQLGYGTSDIKVARVLSKTDLNNAPFRVLRVPSESVAFSGSIQPSGDPWGSFEFTHAIDFTNLTESGCLWIALGARLRHAGGH